MKAIEVITQEVVKKKVPKFRAGDTLKVYLKVKEGDKTRLQLFEGVCIRRRGSGASASFTVLKESHGDKVEKVFPLFSPTIDKITIERRGKFRKARLYHLKNKSK
jgi:large subunit ribosomal protein L19